MPMSALANKEMVGPRLYQAGFRDIIPVVPPGARISTGSRLDPGQLGKVPGELGSSGWHGFRGWPSYEATSDDVQKWSQWGANIGLKAERFPAFDFDFGSEKLTKAIVQRLLRELGPAPERLSRGPRRLLVYRTEAPFRRMALDIQYEGQTHTLEVLGDGLQYVVHGIHPSGAEYRWAGPPLWETTPLDLTCITEADAKGFLERLRDALVGKGIEATLRGGSPSSTGEVPPQESLLAPSLGELAELVEKMPNSYPDRADYIRFMHAVRAAGAQDPAMALAIFQEWALRWDAGDNDPGEVEREFKGLKPPFRVGWRWLQAEADRLGVIVNPRLAALQKLNETYAVAQLGSDVVILQEQEDGEVFFLKQSAFELKLKPEFVPSATGKGKQPLSKAWLNWPGRRQYDRVVFKPGEGASRDEYNLWRGWAVDPSPDGSCDRFLAHLRLVVCNGDAEPFGWLLDWMADLFQHPQEKIGIAVALRGGQGAGKSIVGAVLKKLLGRYQVVVDKPDQVVGRFNSHLASCLLLQAEEAFWGGTRSAAGALKHLVTGDELVIERKGIDSVQMMNYTRLLITTNEDLVWPTSVDDRRLAIFEVSTARVNDLGYFDDIFEELEAGGYEHLLHVLLARKIDRDRLRRAPRTSALVRQATESMGPEEAWLLGFLENGEIRGTVQPGGKAKVALAALYDSYIETLPRAAHRKTQQAFAAFVQEHLLAVKLARRQRVDTALRSQVRSMMYELPPLREVRAAYSARGRAAPEEWDEPGEWTTVNCWGEVETLEVTGSADPGGDIKTGPGAGGSITLDARARKGPRSANQDKPPAGEPAREVA
jgi:Family of unknown function (DUF5906)